MDGVLGGRGVQVVLDLLGQQGLEVLGRRAPEELSVRRAELVPASQVCFLVLELAVPDCRFFPLPP